MATEEIMSENIIQSCHCQRLKRFCLLAFLTWNKRKMWQCVQSPAQICLIIYVVVSAKPFLCQWISSTNATEEWN